MTQAWSQVPAAGAAVRSGRHHRGPATRCGKAAVPDELQADGDVSQWTGRRGHVTVEKRDASAAGRPPRLGDASWRGFTFRWGRAIVTIRDVGDVHMSSTAINWARRTAVQVHQTDVHRAWVEQRLGITHCRCLECSPVRAPRRIQRADTLRQREASSPRPRTSARAQAAVDENWDWTGAKLAVPTHEFDGPGKWPHATFGPRWRVTHPTIPGVVGQSAIMGGVRLWKVTFPIDGDSYWRDASYIVERLDSGAGGNVGPPLQHTPSPSGSGVERSADEGDEGLVPGARRLPSSPIQMTLMDSFACARRPASGSGGDQSAHASSGDVLASPDRATGSAQAGVYCAECEFDVDEDDCIQCCTSCPRVYHLECIGLVEPPSTEQWECSRCESRRACFCSRDAAAAAAAAADEAGRMAMRAAGARQCRWLRPPPVLRVAAKIRESPVAEDYDSRARAVNTSLINTRVRLPPALPGTPPGAFGHITGYSHDTDLFSVRWDGSSERGHDYHRAIDVRSWIAATGDGAAADAVAALGPPPLVRAAQVAKSWAYMLRSAGTFIGPVLDGARGTGIIDRALVSARCCLLCVARTRAVSPLVGRSFPWQGKWAAIWDYFPQDDTVRLDADTTVPVTRSEAWAAILASGGGTQDEAVLASASAVVSSTAFVSPTGVSCMGCASPPASARASVWPRLGRRGPSALLPISPLLDAVRQWTRDQSLRTLHRLVAASLVGAVDRECDWCCARAWLTRPFLGLRWDGGFIVNYVPARHLFVVRRLRVCVEYAAAPVIAGVRGCLQALAELAADGAAAMGGWNAARRRCECVECLPGAAATTAAARFWTPLDISDGLVARPRGGGGPVAEGEPGCVDPDDVR